jgi:hypothetical protein
LYCRDFNENGVPADAAALSFRSKMSGNSK